MKLSIFVSHISDEKDIVKQLTDSLSDAFLGALDFFVSTDYRRLSGGDEWFLKIKEEMNKCNIVFVVCSKKSVNKPWINFEAGAGWFLGKKVVPLCHSGLKPNSLPKPFDLRQVLDITNNDDVIALLNLLAKEADLNVPDIDINRFVEKLSKYQNKSHQDDVSMNLLCGADVIYKDAVDLIDKTQKIIRATSFGDKKKKPSKAYIKSISTKLQQSRSVNRPIEYRLIASHEIDLTARIDIFNENNVLDLVKIKRIESPWAPNVLIIDNCHLHISFIELPSDIAFRRALCFHDKTSIVENIVDWYDNYLWSSEKAVIEKL